MQDGQGSSPQSLRGPLRAVYASEVAASRTDSDPTSKPTNVFPANYRKVDGIYVPKAAGERFQYNDGDAQEEYLLEVIKKATDRSLFSPEIVRSIRDWNSTYHLSPKRANLLRPFSAILRSRVLEIGAGCGAVTRFLGEIGGNVVAVEGSYRRALIARARTEDLDNVEVVVDRIQEFSSRELFNVVVVVGVLEYARVYMNGAVQPEREFLSKLGQLLKRDGVIILAIENKLGLKYLAGAVEDHLGAPFAGINDNYTSGSVVTFGQAELAELLDSTSFTEQRWYVPCPDYKLPTTILSPKIRSAQHELATTLLAQSTPGDPQRPNDPSFSLEQAWSVTVNNKLLEQLANSFLVVAGMTPASLLAIDREKSVAWHYSTERHPAFVKEALFVAQREKIVVQRDHLARQPAPLVPLECIIASEPFVDGRNWWRELCCIVNKPNWSVGDIARWARTWIECLLRDCKLEAFNAETFKKYVSGRYFDAAPFNLMVLADGAYRFIDQEWRLRPDVEFGFLIFRGLRESLLRVTSSAIPAAGTPLNVNMLISAVSADLGVMLTNVELDRFSLLERQVQAWVQGHLAEDVSEEWIARIRNASMRPRAPLERASMIGEHEAALAKLRQQLAQAEAATAARAEEAHRLEDELGAARGQLTEQGEALSRLAAERDALTQAGRTAEQALAEARQQLAQAEAASAGRELELQSRLDVASEKIATNERALAEAREQLAQAEARLNERFGEIATLTRLLREAENTARRTAEETEWIRQTAAVLLGGGSWRGKLVWLLPGPVAHALRKIQLKRRRLFDAKAYLKSHPDVARSGADPLRHYVNFGVREGRRRD